MIPLSLVGRRLYPALTLLSGWRFAFTIFAAVHPTICSGVTLVDLLLSRRSKRLPRSGAASRPFWQNARNLRYRCRADVRLWAIQYVDNYRHAGSSDGDCRAVSF